MRDAFHADLDELNEQLVAMAGSVAEAIRSASAVLLDADPGGAADVIEGDLDINARQYCVDDKVVEIMTRRQPVASDLRLVLASIRISTDLERMGDMAKHVAKIARNLDGSPALPQLRPLFAAMAAAAIRIGDKTTHILATRNRVDAAQLDFDDDELDALYSRLLAELAGDWGHGTQAALDVAMLGRSYERFADHAVRVGHQVVYLVTGAVHLDRPQ
jgi:phosphate transport system protein